MPETRKQEIDQKFNETEQIEFKTNSTAYFFI